MQIFLSYSSNDRSALAPLIKDLEDFGSDVWLDQELVGGEEWWRKILDQIRSSDLLLVALTASSVASEACQLEARYAHDLGKPVVPVRFENIDTAIAPAPFPSLQWVDYFEASRVEAIRVLRAVATTPRRQSVDGVTEPAAPGSYLLPIREAIGSADELSRSRQIELVFELKGHLRIAERREHALLMLHRMLDRNDLLAQIADDIRDAIAVAETETAPASGNIVDEPSEATTDDGPRDELPPPPTRSTRLFEALHHHTGENDVYLGKAIADRKMHNARRMAGVPNDEEVVCLIDLTVFGSAKDAAVLTERGIYYHHVNQDPKQRHWPYETLTADSLSRLSWTTLSIAGEEVTFGGGSSTQKILEVLTDAVNWAHGD